MPIPGQPAPDSQDMPSPADKPADTAGGPDKFGELVTNLSDGLSMLTQLASQVDPETAQGFDQINQQFQQLVSGMAQKMGGGAPAPAGQGMSSPEAGGAAGAKPAGPSY